MNRFVIFLAVALGFGGGCVAAEMTEKERWDFVQEKFITEPGKTFAAGAFCHSRKIETTMKIIGAIPLFASLLITFHSLTEKSLLKKFGKQSTAIALQVCAALFCTECMAEFAGWSVSSLIKYLKNRVDYNAFTDYIEHWEENKDKTPLVLQVPFEKIYTEYKASAKPGKYLKNVVGSLIEDVVKLASVYSKGSIQSNG